MPSNHMVSLLINLLMRYTFSEIEYSQSLISKIANIPFTASIKSLNILKLADFYGFKVLKLMRNVHFKNKGLPGFQKCVKTMAILTIKRLNRNVYFKALKSDKKWS